MWICPCSSVGLERVLGKDEVGSSNLLVGSSENLLKQIFAEKPENFESKYLCRLSVLRRRCLAME